MKELDKVRLLKAAAPAYAEVEDDGAPFTCAECFGEGQGSEMYFTAIPKGNVAMIHKECVDPEWIKMSTKMEWKI